MKLSEWTEKYRSLLEEMKKIEEKIEEFPRIGDTIKHWSEGDEFVLTADKANLIELYGDWDYYKIVKRKTK